VVAVNYPLAYFAERLAGGAAEVVLPVPQGQDPQFWRPGVEEIGTVQRAELTLLNGAGFAGWTERASLPRARTVDTSRAFADALIATEAVTHAHGPDGEHSHEGVAAFTWLDPGQAALQADAVAAALSRLLPEEAAAVEARLDALRADLAQIDAAADALAPLAGGRPLIASHPRYQYLARAHGLTIESVEWEAGAAPDAAQLDALAALAAELGAAAFLWEAEPPAEARDAVRALGLPSAVVPTLASPPEDGDLLSAMQDGLTELSDALARTPTEG
jgi:zinc transport system substrate-binding protein